MGLLLRKEFYHARSPRGVYALTHRGPLVLTGRSVFSLLDTVVPYLDGTHTEEELTATLSPDRLASMRKLIGILRDKGVLTDVTTERAPSRRVEDGAFGNEIRMLGEFCSSPTSVFEQYRDLRVVVLGTGPVEEFARAASRSGSRRFEVWDCRGAEDPAMDVVGGRLAGADIVYHVFDASGLDRGRSVERTCAARDTYLTAVLLAAHEAWLGPIGIVAGADRATSRGRPSLVRRLAGWERLRPGADVGSLRERVLANRAVHGTFRAVTGIEPDGEDRVVRLDLDTWRGRSLPLLAHPYATPCASDSRDQFIARVAALDAGSEVDQEIFDRAVTRCIDDRIGLFGAPTERDYAQLPLHVTEMRVADPVGLLGERASATVTGSGLTNDEARPAAAMAAFAAYGALMVDPRRLVRLDGSPTGLPDDPDEALAALLRRELRAAVWGYDLANGVPVTVAASTVFPALGRGAPSPAPPEGASAGRTWREAVERGLVAQCRRLALDEIASPALPFSRVGHDYHAHDDRELRLLARLTATGEPFTLYDVTGWPGVPTFLCVHGGRAAGCASALLAADARRNALQAALLTYQARQGGHDFAAPSADLPAREFGTASAPVRRDATLSEVVERLHAAEIRAIAVPLDHDPEASKIMPYVAHVVLRHE